jgi:hypothetical protein
MLASPSHRACLRCRHVDDRTCCRQPPVERRRKNASFGVLVSTVGACTTCPKAAGYGGMGGTSRVTKGASRTRAGSSKAAYDSRGMVRLWRRCCDFGRGLLR